MRLCGRRRKGNHAHAGRKVHNVGADRGDGARKVEAADARRVGRGGGACGGEGEKSALAVVQVVGRQRARVHAHDNVAGAASGHGVLCIRYIETKQRWW